MKSVRSPWFTWAPTCDTGVAALTTLAMMALYWTTTQILTSGWSVVLVFGLLTNLGLNTLFPLWWIAIHRRQPLSELGLTTRHWLSSLLVGLVLAGFSAQGLKPYLAGVYWLPHLIFNAVVLWEPFFVFGWLQLCYERAFGILPAVLLAALSFAAYHIGTYPPAGLLVMLVSGLFFATIFRLTTNLLIVWPLAWGVGSSFGTLMGGRLFTWSEVGIWSAILLVQVVLIAYTWYRQKKAG